MKDMLTVRQMKDIQIYTQQRKHIQTNTVFLLFLFYFGSQIDDKEFDIPQVDTPPTLESILNEVKYMLLFDNCYYY